MTLRNFRSFFTRSSEIGFKTSETEGFGNEDSNNG